MAETLSTLKFAKRAKLIKTSAVINEESSGILVYTHAIIYYTYQIPT
jgi:hypothetical protein